MFSVAIRSQPIALVLIPLLLLSGCESVEDEPQSPEQQRLAQIEEAEERFYDLVDNNPNSPEFRPTARFLAEEYRRFADHFETHEDAAEMMFRAANLKADALQEYAIAIGLFRQISQRWPGTEQAERSLFLAGYTHNHMLGQPDQAEPFYRQLIAEYPESELRQAAEEELQFLGTDLEELLRSFEMNEIP
ncbi:MAG: tetratricopeptide repeat protein [Balneolia bacterium]|nr:tetratricopeptide repeat protein [Balneolia bacterium]